MRSGVKDLADGLRELARTPVLLVASDYDGTLAPIVPDPARALPERESVVALRNLSQMPDTHVAVISGRALRDLDAMAKLPEEVHLVGSHGSEFDLDFAERLPPERRELRARIRDELTDICSRGSGLLLEEKPASIAFHYRNAAEEVAQTALDAVLAGPAALPGVQTRHGKKVVELLLVPTDKGLALKKIRRNVGATAVLFFGDDLTDEEAFAVLRGPDVAVKVGEGATQAAHRLDDTTEVARALALLHELREEWLTGGSAVPIEQHSMLSDHRTVALVAPQARITWFCVPRLDSPGLFAELLGGPSAGYFAVLPAGDSTQLGQSYRHSSLVLETRWPSITVTDFLDCSLDRPRRRAGRSDLIRIVEGTGRVALEFAPRLDFGRVPTRLRRHANGLLLEGSVEPIVLRSPRVDWEIHPVGPHHSARAEVELSDSRLVLDLRYGTGNLGDTERSGPERRDLTDQYWRAWASQLTLPPVDTELVLRSALTLKALCYNPTGAIAAAATTSLPEDIGGVRNWDYRFCWPRDAALAAAALVRLGSLGEAMSFLDWMLQVVDSCPSPSYLQPLYGLSGETVPPEAEIRELGGYRGSRPVRISNSAAQQVQLDVFAPVVDVVHVLMQREAPLSSEHWRLVEAMVEAVAERWREPDHGIWEERLPPRQHVHSKVMCWTTVDRALAISRSFLERDRPEWVELRDTIARDVLERGWKPDVGAFTGTYEGDYPDAAALSIGLSGLLDPADERYGATVRAVETHLRRGPTVYRYRIDDGLPGFEGGFHLCTAWLVQAYLAVGREQDAWELYRAMVALAGPTGLLSEQYGPTTERALGNFPQAYSHLALVECALQLSGASRARAAT